MIMYDDYEPTEKEVLEILDKVLDSLIEDEDGDKEDVVLQKERFEDLVMSMLGEIEDYAPDIGDPKGSCYWDGYVDALKWVLTLIDDESEVR